jgi:MSHA biogenesis protein MshQ
VVSGRIRVTNNYGSELLPLPVPVNVQYFGSTSVWTKNTNDSATVINTATNLVQTIIKWPLVSVTPLSAGPLAMTSGATTMTLAKPGVAGTADINFNAPSYLPSTAGRETFGIYKWNNSSLIYMRENY